MNRALTLRSAYSQFLSNIDTLLPISSLSCPPEKLGTHRWLLGQLSSYLKHHMSYTCVVKKHGIILYRQGRELEALSHAMFSARSATEPDFVRICNNINAKIHQQMHTTKATASVSSFHIDQMIQDLDPVLWDAICLLTQNTSEKRKSDRKLQKAFYPTSNHVLH